MGKSPRHLLPWLRCCWGQLHPTSEYLSSSPGSTPSLLLMCTWKAAGEGSSVYIPAIHIGDLDWVPGTWLWPNSAPSDAGICGGYHQIDVSTVCLSLSLCLIASRINKNLKENTAFQPCDPMVINKQEVCPDLSCGLWSKYSVTEMSRVYREGTQC